MLKKIFHIGRDAVLFAHWGFLGLTFSDLN